MEEIIFLITRTVLLCCSITIMYMAVITEKEFLDSTWL